MQYVEFPPWPTLASLVDRVWTLTGSAGDLSTSVQPVLPDGRPELVMHFGEPFERVSVNGEVSKQAATLFAGQLTGQLTLKPAGAVAVLGVRFHPHGAWPLFRVPQREVTGLTLDVEDLSPDLSQALCAVRDQTHDVHTAVPLVQRVLERRIADVRFDRRVEVATRTIIDTDGAVSIDALAESVALTRRHLERLFLDAVGLPPKRLARIARFQKAVRMLTDIDPRGRGAVTAAQCGYADQAHFIRDFRQLAGCSPSEHLLRQAELTRFFLDGSSQLPAPSS
jgi:AraC-like DNA-binding protein